MVEAQNLIRQLFSDTASSPKMRDSLILCPGRQLAHLPALSSLALPSAVPDFRIGCAFADSCDEALWRQLCARHWRQRGGGSCGENGREACSRPEGREEGGGAPDTETSFLDGKAQKPGAVLGAWF